MLAYLEGEVLHKTADAVICKVNGIGYHVTVGQRCAETLAVQSGPVALWIEESIRDGHIVLFGFRTQDEVTWFRWLVLVPGVGGKVALAILSAFSVEQLHTLILEEQDGLLRSVEGVGAKLATRLVHELRDKALKWGPVTSYMPAHEDALQGLCSLGYSRVEAQQLLSKALSTAPHATPSELIRLSLTHTVGRA